MNAVNYRLYTIWAGVLLEAKSLRFMHSESKIKWFPLH